VATKERAADRGLRRGRDLYLAAARELRIARVDRGLSLSAVGRASGLSASALSRIERGLVPACSLLRLAQLHAIVGLDLAVRSYPGGSPIRDAGHVALLGAFGSGLHRSLRWSTEAPLPIPGDRRAWDGFVASGKWRYGVEVETAPSDGQALARRIQLKQRDGQVDGVILVLPRTRRVEQFLAGAAGSLQPQFPVSGRRALELLAAGADPGGSAIVRIRRGLARPSARCASRM